MKTKIDIHQKVTDQIIASLEEGTRPWNKPWNDGAGGLPLRHNGEPYQGINILLLWMASRSEAHWMTFNQAAQLCGMKKRSNGKGWEFEEGKGVRKDEKGTTIIFYKPLDTVDKVTGEDITIPLMRAYSVFNADQIDGLPDKYYSQNVEALNSDERDANADAFVHHTGAELRHGGNRAFYSPGEDFIQLPAYDSFKSSEGYYAVALHELGHWTGHKDRLNRDIRNAFGTKDYAREELIAEMSSAFLCADLQINAEPRPDHASYLEAWLKIMKEDKKAIFSAATAASKVAGYLHTLQSNEERKVA
jgi:antirestriction protein ArdC